MMLSTINSTTNNNCIIGNIMTNHGTQSKDEVDFVLRPHQATIVVNKDWKKEDVPPPTTVAVVDQQQIHNKKIEIQNGLKKSVLPNRTNYNNVTSNNNNDVKGNIKASLSSLDRLSLFAFSKKINNKSSPSVVTNDSTQTNDTKLQMSLIGTIPQDAQNCGNHHQHHKFVKAASIARLLGNTYNTKKFEKELAAASGGNGGGDVKTKFNTFSGGRRRTNAPYMERFKKYCKEDEDLPDIGSGCHGGGGGSGLSTTTSLSVSNKDVAALNLENFHDSNKDLSAKAFRTISRGLGKLWWKRTHSVDISNPDPEFKVSYLGNVLTGWAKGEGCVEKQLNTLWRNYQQNNKPDVIMRIKVCASGLKATTRQHGLTEYWANRITHCCAPKNFPRVFCWIYRHEGRKLKHELRCHAILCSKEKVVQEICSTLKENLDRALRDFKREKILKQNARLSLANSAYDNPSLPRRKILLSVGGNNYRPPLERSKSAPKLMAIEEAIGEEDGEEIEETNEPEMKACCQKDSLYPAMTLGRRRCRRGHSIRRTGKTRPNFCETFDNITSSNGCCNTKEHSKAMTKQHDDEHKNDESNKKSADLGSDEDDYEKLLIFNNYDTDSPLAGELLPYFDLQMIKNTNSTSLNDLTNSLNDLDHDGDNHGEDGLVEEHPNYEPSAGHIEAERPCQNTIGGLCSDDDDEEELSTDDLFFRQASILNMLHRNSMRKIQHLSMSSEESSLENQGTSSVAPVIANRKQLSMDSDEGSISSGCETASTVTANADDISLKFRHLQQQQRTQTISYSSTEGPSTAEDTAAEEENCQRNSNEGLFCSKISLKLQQPNSSFKESTRLKPKNDHDGSDSECSDESGYVEYQDVQKTANISSSSSQRASTSTAV
ncbi:uncharacterized protein LOC129917219 [Episyrphus balteatus]|uniref:uncharacterized protein LOC129917219 n=1 Tax=Episyrphus balteatus TaxID=286459 RepID=UPI00248639ED|nr:uncharacterized protein LOC129917219 [Episyrphus balteatus]XP_055853595.1 uncharacterized protein LOC129917219 [Episyrphus balteatus]